MKRAVFLASVVVASVFTLPVEAAFNGFYSDQVIQTYDKNATAVCTPGSSNATAGTKVDLGNVPDPWRSLIISTAGLYPDADARLVAATLWAENRSWPDYNKKWATSPRGASGPWQFIPSTWASMGTDGDKDGVKDPNNPKDAVHAAFKHQAGSSGKPIIEGYNGNLATGLNLVFRRTGKPSLLAFMANYNGRGAPENTTLKAFPRNENSDYVIMGYYLLASNFSQGWSPSTGKSVDAASGSAASGSPIAGSVNCTGASGAVDANGYAFPIGLKKSEVSSGYSWPCQSTCHHDDTGAFDLAHKGTVAAKKADKDNLTVGKPVFAIFSGKIDSVDNSYADIAGCVSFQLVGKDGWKYWYGHLARASVKEGQTVAAGETLAEVGERKCTGNKSYPHLHIDRGSPKGRAGGSVGFRDTAFVQLMNQLYEGLPNE